MDIRCRNCRRVLVSPESEIEALNGHGEKLSHDKVRGENCLSLSLPTSVYIDPENAANVDWLQKEISDSEWSKGKLKCSSCSAVVGSFSFLNSIACDCKKFQLPPLQFILSKIDIKKDLQLP